MASIVVYNLGPWTTAHDLRLIYEDFGNVEKVLLSYNFAIISFENFEDALDAMDATNGLLLDNRKLLVTMGN
jgi:RNA recognition motif-containing protein